MIEPEGNRIVETEDKCLAASRENHEKSSKQNPSSRVDFIAEWGQFVVSVSVAQGSLFFGKYELVFPKYLIIKGLRKDINSSKLPNGHVFFVPCVFYLIF